MRKINTEDVFAALRLVETSGMREEITEMIKKISADDDRMDVGITGILKIVEIFGRAKNERALYQWLSGPWEMKPEDVGKMTLDELADKMEQTAQENDVARFFSVVSKFLSKKR